MKKKITVVALALSLLAIVVAGSTLAWFTSEDSATNTFVIGEVKIAQYEMEPDGNGGFQTFTQNQTMLPIVNTTNVSEDANYIHKLVSVKNEGRNDAYVRTFIAVPKEIASIIHLDLNENAGWVQDTNTYETQIVKHEYMENGETKEYNVEYAILSFTYNTALVKDQKTSDVLLGVYMDAAVDVKDNGSGERQFCTSDGNGNYTFYSYDISKPVKVLVATQACQADGFTEGAVDTLDTVFYKKAPNFANINQ